MENQFGQNRKWKCFYCDNFTDFTSDYCCICDAKNENIANERVFERKNVDYQRNKETPTNDHTLDQWKCNNCSTMNSSENKICFNCHRNDPDNGKWTCEGCTKKNEKFEENCSVCYQLSPFIKPCPKCGVLVIDVRYNRQCENCTIKMSQTKSELVLNKIDGRNHNEEWSCSKCTFKNSVDVLMCGVCNNKDTITRNTWTCVSCTFKNDVRLTNCSVCGNINQASEPRKPIIAPSKGTIEPIRQTGERMLNFSVTLDELDELKRITMEPIGDLFNMVKPVAEKTFCRRCHEVLGANEVEELCNHCGWEYYICKNNGCEMLLEKTKVMCSKCGMMKLEKVRYTKEPGRGWLCSYKECNFINEDNHDLCVNCCCFRDVNENKVMCIKCGWIKSKVSTCCNKCGSAV